MSAILHGWYPGDRALEFALIVVLGVTFLSTVAWSIARWLAHQPASRHLILTSALFGCLATPVLAAILSACGSTLVSIPILPAVQSRPESAGRTTTIFPTTTRPEVAARGQLTTPAVVVARPDREPDLGPVSPITPAPRASTEQPESTARPTTRFLSYQEITTVATLVWGFGSLILGLRIVWGCLLVNRLFRSCRSLHDGLMDQRRREMIGPLGIKSLPQVLISAHAVTPVAVGVLRPVIILPESLISEISEDELLDILLHEMAHVSRRDTLLVLVQELVRALYWPIVTVHALVCELRRAREELCDNYVLQHRDALSYGETLLHLAELSLDRRPLAAAVGILHWSGELERRIAGLLQEGRSTMTRSNRWLVFLVALSFLGGGVLASSTRFIAGGKVKQESVPLASGANEIQPRAVALAKAEVAPNRTMLVHVLGPDGQPMAGVKVHRSVWTRKPGARGNMDYFTDERGEVDIEIPEGIYILRIWARTKHHVPLFAHWEEEDVPERNLPAEYTFHLTKGTVIGGLVENSAGQPIKGVSVEVKLQSGGESEGRTGPDVWLSEGETPITDAEGRWTLDNIPLSLNLNLRLKLSHPDYVSDREWGEMQQSQGIDLKALRSRKAILVMKGGLVATGSVTDPEGKPVARAVVVRGDDPYSEVGSQEVLTDEQGRYQLPPLPSGSLTITVMAPGWMPALQEVEIRQGMKPLDFRLKPGKQLRIRFVDSDQKAIPGVYVMIDKWRGGQSLYNHRHPNVINTQIPHQADEAGVYRWSWAPDDPVSYVFERKGFVWHEASLTAQEGEQTVTLQRILRMRGSVRDATTEQPVARFTAIPVVERGPGFLFVWRNGARAFSRGTFEVEADRTDVSYRVRIEADGYRSAMSDLVPAGSPPVNLDLRLQPAPALAGRVVDSNGHPVKEAWAYLATHSVNLNGGPNGEDQWPDQKVLTDSNGHFSFPAQFERYTIVAASDMGYAERTREPDQQPGDLTLLRWAHVEGRVLQAGKAVPNVWVSFHPIRVLTGTQPHIQDQTSVETDQNGHFVFPRVPPVKTSIKAQLSVWQDSPLSSSQSIPLDLKPEEHAVLELGGQGTVVKGRVLLTGDAASKIDIHKSLNWLLRKTPGIEPPEPVRAAGLDARHGWDHSWTASQEGLALIESLHTYFVVLDKDGRFSISGVPAGDYDLALRLYEPPGEGCLVSPVGARIVRFQVSNEAARRSAMDLGEIPVKVAIGPRHGDVVPDLAINDSERNARSLSALRGRYVLVDFWATWCAPCVASLPSLAHVRETFGKEDRLTALGINIDDDPDQARAFVDKQKLTWDQAFLGHRPDKDEILTRYGISSVPTYLLIGPDGKLIERSDNLQVVTQALDRALR